MRAALSLAGMGLSVFIIERESEPGGWASQVGWMGPDRSARPRGGSKPAGRRFARNDNIILYTNAELTAKKGHIGDFIVTVRLRGEGGTFHSTWGRSLSRQALRPTSPAMANMAGVMSGVVTLKDFRQMLEAERRPVDLQRKAGTGRRLHLLCRQSTDAKRRLPGAQHTLLAVLLHGHGFHWQLAARA